MMIKKILAISLYLKNKIIRSKKIKSTQRLRYIEKEYIIFLVMLLMVIFYYIFFKSKTQSLILLSLLLSIYSSINIFLKKHLTYQYIDEKFDLEKSINEKKKNEMLKKQNSINRIIIIDNNGKEIDIINVNKEKYIIGRKTKNNNIDIDLSNYKNAELISKIHASIFKKNEYWYVRDEKSKNGTYILKTNNRKFLLKDSEEIINVGDMIEINNKIRLLVN
ncbi:FHA domain-containing protein [Oceanivirga salmonicida]|nr:FHA domain-containing protein [Oceanivirga salmonicida]